ncbi:MAG: hypothetical protein J5871_02855 [Bacteroidales bacterium]|nr:hypothetical protein [Bacteroidales bacterium]
MRFADIHTDADVVRALKGMVDGGKVPHALLFREPDGGGAVPLCLAFLQYLFCRNRQEEDSCGVCPSCNKVSKLIHPDIRFIFPTAASDKSRPGEARSVQQAGVFRALVTEHPYFRESELADALGIEGKSSLIAVAEARELLTSLAMSSLEGGWRAVVMYLPEKMNQETANRLLKAIEEPEQRTLFLLVTHAMEKVLPTIASRCQRITVHGEDGRRAPDFPEPELFADLMDALLARDLWAALDVGERIAALPSRESVKAFCIFAADALRNVFLVQQGLPQLGDAQGRTAEWAAKCRKSFPRNAMACFNRARMLVERNVNQKLLSADLVNRLSGWV